ncbi:MAG: GC-type dockerin domain-anchored protein [Phycisphaerales bacterium JB052]
MLNTRNRCGAASAFAVVGFLGGATAVHGSEIVPESRESEIILVSSNLGYDMGYTGGGIGPVFFEEAGLDSGDDMLVLGNLFYGPDGFDRINSGSYDARQDVTFDETTIAYDLTSFASVTGDASPLINVANRVYHFFTVSEDTSATVSVAYDGDTNVGDDEVALRLRRIGQGDDPDILETLFALELYPDGPGTVEEEVELLAGERYRLYVYARARSINDSGAASSQVDMQLTLPSCAADLNGDGSLDFFDVSMFLTAYSAMDPVADFNGDGSYDFFDVSAFLTAYNAGCP